MNEYRTKSECDHLERVKQDNAKARDARSQLRKMAMDNIAAWYTRNKMLMTSVEQLAERIFGNTGVESLRAVRGAIYRLRRKHDFQLWMDPESHCIFLASRQNPEPTHRKFRLLTLTAAGMDESSLTITKHVEAGRTQHDHLVQNVKSKRRSEVTPLVI